MIPRAASDGGDWSPLQSPGAGGSLWFGDTNPFVLEDVLVIASH